MVKVEKVVLEKDDIQKIIDARKAKGLKPEEVAEQIGVSGSYWRLVESHRTKDKGVITSYSRVEKLYNMFEDNSLGYLLYEGKDLNKNLANKLDEALDENLKNLQRDFSRFNIDKKYDFLKDLGELYSKYVSKEYNDSVSSNSSDSSN